MKKLSAAVGSLLLVLTLSACVVTVEAQTLPVTLHVEWSPNPASDAVTAYTVTLDTGTPQNVDPTTGCTATVCRSASFAINDTTQHTISVTATNAIDTSTPATIQFNVKITGVSGLTLKKG